jgi:steroid 5-alpha reductase family enzyme
MFWFLMIQAVVGALLALCVAVAARAPAALRPLDMAAGLVFAAGVIGESLSDRQMHRFRANPANRGRVCDTGLWGWSRHPNYFFECLTWCAYPLFAIAPGYGWGYAAILGPAAMVLLLTKASGIPPLEREMLESRGPAFAAYQARVSAFIPLPPKSTRETDMKTGPTP